MSTAPINPVGTGALVINNTELSQAERISLLSPSKRRKVLRGFTDEQIEALQQDWRFWGRPSQFAPEGNWSGWLIRAGRGFGKTRAGAEWIRERVTAGARYINLIGSTAADARDVMVEGESGLLSIFPKEQRPLYEPSKRRLTFHTGCNGSIFSADEPERLRGPQCLVGETLVTMADGTERPIRHVVAGDWVLTRKGPRRVTKSVMTSTKADVCRLLVVGGRNIIGTSEHPVFVSGIGFVELSKVPIGGAVCVTPALSGTGAHGTRSQAAVTTKREYSCTERYTRAFTGQSLKDSTFTIRTKTSTTTGSKTSSCYRVATTAACTAAKILIHTRTRLAQRQRKHDSATARFDLNANSTVASAAVSTEAAPSGQPSFAPQSALKLFGRVPSRARCGLVNNAGWIIGQQGASSGTVPNAATRLRVRRDHARFGRSFAISAGKSLNHPAEMHGSAGDHVPLFSTQTIESVEKLAKQQPVYDITVDDAHEFFANGILVHNCDTLWADEIGAWRRPEAWDLAMMGLRLGSDPRWCATTTPRPTQLIKDMVKDPTVVITTGSTYANRANLASQFLSQIITKYEGTRLGRQEVEGLLLLDVPGALWTYETLEKAIWREDLPTMRRIVVALDPATTSGEDADDTGIIVAGLGVDGRGYVLADHTGKYTPSGWADKALAAYDAWHADRIIGETNNGGDLIESNIRTMRRHVSFKKVTASRGKIVRAEPVASLYEQGRVSHAGVFKALEEQMTGYVPDSGMPSPNNMDAMVWAFTDLMVDAKPLRISVV